MRIIVVTVLAMAACVAAGADRPGPVLGGAGKKGPRHAGLTWARTGAIPSFQTTWNEVTDRHDREVAHQGIKLLMNGDPDAAIEVFRQDLDDDLPS